MRSILCQFLLSVFSKGVEPRGVSTGPSAGQLSCILFRRPDAQGLLSAGRRVSRDRLRIAVREMQVARHVTCDQVRYHAFIQNSSDETSGYEHRELAEVLVLLVVVICLPAVAQRPT